MAALQFVDVPGYSALLLRRTFTDLSLPGALMSMAKEWLSGTDATWNAQTKSWVFPSGATLTFGFLENEDDKYRYQSSEFQFIGFDELTQFSEEQYRYLFSRLRKLLTADVPLRVRSASNPGGYGHEWVKNRFITPIDSTKRVVYIPARLDDNPYLDKERYVESLNRLDAVTREQLLHGDWAIQVQGNFFKRQWFEIVEAYPEDARHLRFWDKAASLDGDYTAGALLAEKNGIFYLVDMIRFKDTSKGVEDVIKQTAIRDDCAVRMEQEPGSAGVDNIDHYARTVLIGYDFKGIKSTGDKVSRAGIVSSSAEAGNLKLIKGAWIGAFLDEAVIFPEGQHDDQIDALSGAMIALANRPNPSRFSVMHRGSYGGQHR